MGVFDFVRNVGAKVGIGKSTDEIEQEKQAETDARNERREKARAEATARREQAAKAATDQREKLERRARIAERRAEAGKSRELEDYVRKLGLECDDLDIRFDDGTAYIEGTAASSAVREKIILAVGNVEGVEKVDEEIDVEAPAPDAVFHTVAAGDTLWAVAEKVYGDGNRYTEIFEANKPMLTDPDLIYPGQVLRCPQ